MGSSSKGDAYGADDLVELHSELRRLRDALQSAERDRAGEIADAHPSQRPSATNLVHYVELRNHDVRALQSQLAAHGLSSLGRSESHVLGTIDTLLQVLSRLTGIEPPAPAATAASTEAAGRLSGNANDLLGPAPPDRSTRIMVTMPSEAAEDQRLVPGLIAQGMDLARVNCAHDDAQAWTRMIDLIRSTPTPDGRRCRVAMDLGGPKLRTGPLEPGPRVMKASPKRDKAGRVTSPARLWLTAPGGAVPARSANGLAAIVPVDDRAWVSRRRQGDRLVLRDSRGAKRTWEVIEVFDDACLASTTKTTYVMTGMKIACQEPSGDDLVAIGELPAIEQAHRVHVGDRIVLTRSLAPAAPTPAGTTHAIGCTLPQVFQHARPGEPVWLDDGKIGGIVDQVSLDEIILNVTDVRPGGANLKAGKGINLPATDLHLDALTAKDLEDLPFVAAHADLVNLSFVRRPQDIRELQRGLEKLNAGSVGIVLKIENVAAFENLPELLLTAMRNQRVGVMIARGDLAVEIGFDRLAEVQEEIMWVCEAAHIPVIWATQVLDTLAHTGQPSRAEVTDAAMSGRTECVMLNKGPHIVDAIGVLSSILTRMQDHHDKKRSLLRRLRAWDHPETSGTS